MSRKSIARHKVDLKGCRHLHDARIAFMEDQFEATQLNAVQATSYVRSVLAVLACGTVIGRSGAELMPLAKAAASVRLAIFQAASDGSATTHTERGRKTVSADLRQDESLLGAAAWLDAFFLGLAFGPESDLRKHLDFPTQVLKSSSAKPLKFELALIDYIKDVWGELRDSNSHFDACVKISARTKPGPIWSRMIGGAWLATVDSIRVDGDDTEDILSDAVELHKEYWTSTAGLKADCAGFLSIPLLAAVRWAHTLGSRLEVRSDYIPPGLVATALATKW